LSEDMKLASALGFSGTPSYVVGDDVVLGAVGLPALLQHIEKARAAVSTAKAGLPEAEKPAN